MNNRTVLAICCCIWAATRANGSCVVSAAPRTHAIATGNLRKRDVIAREDLHSLLKRTLADVDATLAQFDANQLLERRSIQGLDVSVLEAILHVVEHFSMHVGQILYITKQLTAHDLHFYDL